MKVSDVAFLRTLGSSFGWEMDGMRGKGEKVAPAGSVREPCLALGPLCPHQRKLSRCDGIENIRRRAPLYERPAPPLPPRY